MIGALMIEGVPSRTNALIRAALFFAAAFLAPNSLLGQGTIVFPPGLPPTRPANDDFAQATVLPGGRAFFEHVNFSGATSQTGEPAHGDSVWFRWTAPANAPVVIDSREFCIAIYRGSAVNALTAVPMSVLEVNEFVPPWEPSVWVYPPTNRVVFQTRFDAIEGQTYQIAALRPASFFGRQFQFQLEQQTMKVASLTPPSPRVGETARIEIAPLDDSEALASVSAAIGETSLGQVTTAPFVFDFTPATEGPIIIAATGKTTAGETKNLWAHVTVRPRNDHMASAHELSGLVIDRAFSYSSEFATHETNEPAVLSATNTPTVWWKWTPTESAVTYIRSPKDAQLVLYRGSSSPTNAQPIANLSWNRANFANQIQLWSGYGDDFQALFTNEAHVTYWISAVSPQSRSNGWRIHRIVHWPEVEAKPVGQTTRVLLNTNGVGPGPTSITLRIFVAGEYYNPIKTVEISDLGRVLLEWEPTEPGRFYALVEARYASGDAWTNSAGIWITPRNDDFDAATVIPPGFSSGTLPIQGGYSTAQANEPLVGTNAPAGTIWWRWTPDHSGTLYLRAVRSGTGYPIEIFKGSNVSNLTLVAHNHGRYGKAPLLGIVEFNFTAGETYSIRMAHTDPFVVTLHMDSADTPLPGLIALSTALVSRSPEGELTWKIFGKAFTEDGAPFYPHYRGQFYCGKTIDTLAPLAGPAWPYYRDFGDIVELRGTMNAGLATVTNLHAGEEALVQLRVWREAFDSYEDARRANKSVGKSKIISVKLGSEVTSPALLTEIGDAFLMAPTEPFTPGILSAAMAPGPAFTLTGGAGIYAIETSDLNGPWRLVTTVTNAGGVFPIQADLSTTLGFYRSRLLD